MSTVSLSLKLSPFISPPRTHLNSHHFSPKPPIKNLSLFSPRLRCLPIIKSVHQNPDISPVTSSEPPRWERVLLNAATLYPLYVTVGGVVACLKPSIFAWFVQRGPASYSLSLGLIMLAMGLTLELKDLISLFIQRPLSVSFRLCLEEFCCLLICLFVYLIVFRTVVSWIGKLFKLVI